MECTWQHKCKKDEDWLDYARAHGEQLSRAYIQGTEIVTLKSGPLEWIVNLKEMKQEPKRQGLFQKKYVRMCFHNMVYEYAVSCFYLKMFSHIYATRLYFLSVAHKRFVRCIGGNGVCWPPLDLRSSKDERAAMASAAAAAPPELPDASSARGAATLIDAIEQRFQNLPLAFQHVPTWPNIEEMLMQAPANITALQKNLISARLLIHPAVMPLLTYFLRHKCSFGTLSEFSIYNGMTALDLVDRLVSKRPVVFRGGNDSYVLSDQSTGVGGFEQVPTGKFRWPMHKIISYDEMYLSALVSVGGPTQFLNSGLNGNKGRYVEGRHIREGVCVGCAGPRLQRPGEMDCRHVLVWCLLCAMVCEDMSPCKHA